MRGGLDDALDKLARRDELRRRANGQSPGTPPAVTELVEAIAGVVSRHPNLNVTVGVEGAGDPTLLHFAFADGVVQVNADHPVAATHAAEAPKHADFEIEVEDEEPVTAYPSGSHDDQDRFGPTDYDYDYAEPPTAERPFVAPSVPVPHDPATPNHPGQTRRDDLATQQQPGAGPARHAPHPFAAAPPTPIPSPYAAAAPHPYAPTPPPPVPPVGYSEPPRHQAPPAGPAPAQPAEPQSGYPEPLVQPVPLQVERPEETEMAARRLAAMLRDNPTLLDDPPG